MKDKILFSIVVPVYNTANYLNKCIGSILNQSYDNYEIIVINDGSTDNSKEILEEYKANKKITIITQKNKGLSVARNNGIKKSKGDYIIFLDSDDYIDYKLLEKLYDNITDDVELIRYQARTVNENYETIREYSEEEFGTISNDDAIKKIVKYHFVENSWLYCYKRELFTQKKLKFDVGFIHEDFGLTPLILLKSNKILSINYIGYNYLIRQNSIMNDDKKVQKKCNDFITLGIRNIDIIKKSNLKNKDILLSYIANSIILKGRELNRVYRKYYLKIIKDNEIDKYLLTDTVSRKIKKVIFNISYDLYLKVI